MHTALYDVVDVRPEDGHLLQLVFEDGAKRTFDMSRFFGRKPYANIRDRSVFDCARVEFGTVVWPGGIDIDPETLRGGN